MKPTTADIAIDIFGIQLRDGKQECPLPTHPKDAKSLSFNYDVRKDYWFCHHEKVGGDGLELYRVMTGKNYSDVFSDIEKRYNIKLDSRDKERQTKQAEKPPATEEFLAFCEDLAERANRNLLNNVSAMLFCAKKWGFDEPIIKKYRIGFLSEDEYNNVVQKYGHDTLLRFGARGNAENRAGFWDVLKGRIIFPFFTWDNKIEYFTGRVID